jgi:hypothetical protein
VHARAADACDGGGVTGPTPASGRRRRRPRGGGELEHGHSSGSDRVV